MSLADQVWAKGLSLSSETYLPKLLEGLEGLRSQNVLCDVTLEAEGVPFPAHKAILAVASSYCKMRFMGDGRCSESLVKLAGITAKGLQNVLSFLYSNQLELTLQTVVETFKAAEEMMVREAMSLCFQFLEDALNPHTCLEILGIAKWLRAEELAQKAKDCMSCHGGEILADPAQLKNLDGATLCQILDNGNVGNLTELELFHAVVRWLQHDGIRMKDADAILQRIRFPLIPIQDLQELVKDVPLVRTEPMCRKYLQEALDYNAQPYAQPTLQTERTQVRTGADSLLILGGRLVDNTVWGDVWVTDSSCHSWKKVGTLITPVYNHCVAVIHNFVFVLGGQEMYDPTGQRPSNQVFRFDPRHNAWLEVASMQERRTRFYAGTLNDHLVAVGGGTLLGTLTNTAEEYWPAENEWRLLPPFPMPVADHAGASHKGILYIAGGFTAGKTVSEMYSYLSRLRRWIKNHQMNFARCDHGMAAVGDRIFCLGGRAQTDAGEWIPINQAECYCPASDQWTVFSLSAFDLCHFSLAAYQLQMYITGGGSVTRRAKEDGVFIYHPGEKAWEKVGSLPAALADHGSCFVRLPCQISSDETQKGEETSSPGKKKSILNHTHQHQPEGDRAPIAAPDRQPQCLVCFCCLDHGAQSMAQGPDLSPNTNSSGPRSPRHSWKWK